MAETVIEWVRNQDGELGYTFNGWIGCEPISRGCDGCYAEVDTPTRVLRAKGIETWGPHAERHRTSAANWRMPKRWDRKAADSSMRLRVFCASLSDWLDNKVPVQWLVELLDLVRQTPNLDWLMLTKRIGNWRSRLDAALELASSSGMSDLASWIADWLAGRAPAHVWLGATVVNQVEVDRDVVKLLRTPAARRFLSMEPLLGPVSFEGVFANPNNPADGTNALEALDWVIVGGESGPNARPMHPDWVRSLRDQCAAVDVPFLFKQWGEWLPINQQDEAFTNRLYASNRKARPHQDQGVLDDIYGRRCTVPYAVVHNDGSVHEPLEPMAFRVGTGAMTTFKVDKKAAGRLLDGHLHDASPKPL